MSRTARVAALLAVAIGCAVGETPRVDARDVAGPNYIQHVAFGIPGRGGTVMRRQWSEMPLRVHLPAPPAGMFDDSERVMAAVRAGILDWTDVAAKIAGAKRRQE